MNPVNMDIFSRFMADAFDEREVIGVPTGFQTFFGNPVANGSRTIFSPDANVVDIDIIRGNERTAALIPRGTVSRPLGSGQKNLRQEQFSAFSRKYPLAEEETDITGDQLLNRTAGEQPYQTADRMTRLRILGVRAHMESVRRQVRLFERLAAQSITTGKQDAILGTTNTELQYDFRRNATHTVTVGTSWLNAAADIVADVDAICLKIRANGHVMPDMMICGSSAINGIVLNTAIKNVADNRRFEFVQLGGSNGDDAILMPMLSKYKRFVDGGFIPRGLLRTPQGFEVMIFTYIDGYTDDAGTYTKYLADDKVVICCSTARADRYFGPPENLPMTSTRAALYREFFGFDPSAPTLPPNIKGGVIDPAMFYADAYVSADAKRVTMRCQSAPIFATTQTDGFATLDVVP